MGEDRHEPYSSENKKFIKFTIQQVIAGFIALVLAGILTFMGTTLVSALEDVKKHETRLTKIETWKEEALLDALNDLDNSLRNFKKDTLTTMGSMSGEQKKILRSISKMEGILEELRRR